MCVTKLGPSFAACNRRHASIVRGYIPSHVPEACLTLTYDICDKYMNKLFTVAFFKFSPRVGANSADFKFFSRVGMNSAENRVTCNVLTLNCV